MALRRVDQGTWRLWQRKGRLWARSMMKFYGKERKMRQSRRGSWGERIRRCWAKSLQNENNGWGKAETAVWLKLETVWRSIPQWKELLSEVMKWKQLWLNGASPVAQILVKNLPAMQETRVWSLGQEDPPGGGNDSLPQYYCLENPMDRVAWWAIVYGIAKSWTWLNH